MKKILVFMLAMLLVLAFTACKTECETHVDENADGICDVCEEAVGNTPQHTVHADTNEDGKCDGCDSIMIDYSKPTVVGKILKSSLEKQFKEAKSAKVDLDFTFINVQSGAEYEQVWDEDLEDYVSNEDVIEEYEYYTEYAVKAEMWLTESEEFVDVKAVLNLSVRDTEDGEFVTQDPITFYIIDGCLYNDMGDGEYHKRDLIPTKLKKLIDALSDIELFTEQEKNDMLSDLGVQLVTVFNIKDYKGSAGFDAAPALNDLLAYFKELDFERCTTKEFFDDMLARVSEDLTVDGILDQLESLAALTVNEALVKLDAWLTKNYETTLQDIYTSIVTQDGAEALVELIILEMNDLDEPTDEIQEIIDENIAILQSVVIADLIAEQELGDVVLYDLFMNLVTGFVGADDEVTYPPAEEMFDNLRELLDLPLAQFDQSIVVPVFSMLKQIASGIEINALNGALDINFEGLLSVKSVNATLNVDISNTMPSEIEGYDNFSRIAVSVTLTVSDISTSENPVVLPNPTQIIHMSLVNNEFYGEYGDAETIYYFDEESGEYVVDLYMNFIDPEQYVYISIYSYSIPMSEFGTRTVIDDYSVAYNDEELAVPAGASFTIVFDPAGGTFTFEELPTYDLPKGLEFIFTSMVSQETTSFGEYTLDPDVNALDFSIYGTVAIFGNHEQISHLYFRSIYDQSSNRLNCTITGFSLKSGVYLRKPTTGTTWMGGCYNDEEIRAYFGDDYNFYIYLDEATGTVTFEDISVLEEYVVQ